MTKPMNILKHLVITNVIHDVAYDRQHLAVSALEWNN